MTQEKENEALAIIDECNKNIENGEVNSFSSYDEGVRDALSWLLEDCEKPYIGRE